MDRSYLRLMFRIRLHTDDVQILYTIRDSLGVGRVNIHATNCVYTISNVTELITVLLPLLELYSLRTTKYLDYLDFKSAALLLASLPSSRLGTDHTLWIRSLMARMNSGRTLYDYASIPAITVVDQLWLLGFIEGEGTFGFKNLVPYFQLGQHQRSLMVLEAITHYLTTLPNLFGSVVISPSPIVSNTLNQRTSVNVLAISNIDALHDYLAFMLLSMPFQTRKSVDFMYWCLALHFHKYGYYYLPQGRAVILAISRYINGSRYSNAECPTSPPDMQSILDVLSLVLPITLTPQMSHLILAQSFARLVTDRQI